MPRVHSSGSWAIYVYADDHNPPHFHIVGRGWDVKVAIGSGEIIGKGPMAQVSEALEWAVHNQDAVRQAWSTYNERD